MLAAAVTMAIQAAAVGLPGPQASAASAFAGPVRLSRGRTIYLQCSGSGRFTVVLEPGDGGHRQHMAKLFDQLSSRYRVCAYDRRNMGLSSKAPLPRKAADLSADLYDSLEARGEKGPFVLFGSSIGGLLVRLHAATHTVAGFVTSNQVGTTAEWRAATYRLMSTKERRRDREWQAGANNEHIDVNDVSRVIQRAGPLAVPYVIMISTERLQCPATETCGPIYRGYVRMSERTAHSGRRGSLLLFDGAHDLYLTHLPEVLAAIDEVVRMASSDGAR